MSVVGVSPTDLVNGALAVKRIIEALKADNGSAEKLSTALTSTEHHLAAIETLDKVLETMQDGATLSTAEIQNRISHLHASQKVDLAQLSKYQSPPSGSKTCKGQAKKVRKKLAWAFGGEKEFGEASARIASASNAVQLDAIMLTGKCTQSEIAKLEPLLCPKLDSVMETIQASQSESVRGTRDILNCISRAHPEILTLAQEMQTAIERMGSSQSQEATDTKKSPLTIIRSRLPRLESHIEIHGPIPLSGTPSRPDGGKSRVIPEEFITPILIATLYYLTTHQRVQNMLRGFVHLAKTDPASVSLIVCILVALSRMTAHLLRPLSLLGADQVSFNDAFGSSLSLPFKICEYPVSFSKFIKDHFSCHPARSLILDGTYHLNLNGSRRQLVTNQTWSSFVKPNSKITMSIFWDSSDKRCIRCRKSLLFHEPNDLVCTSCGGWYPIYLDAFAFSNLKDEEEGNGGIQGDDKVSAMEVFGMIQNLHAWISPDAFENASKPDPVPKRGAKKAKNKLDKQADTGSASRNRSPSRVRPRRKLQVWYCCLCHGGPFLATNNTHCSDCHRRRCKQCKDELL